MPTTGRPFLIQSTERARCTPDAVMDRLLDASTWPAWQPEIVTAEGPERLTAGGVVEGTATMLGFGVHGRSVVSSLEQESVEEEVIVGVRMRVRYEIRPSNDGCEVVHQLECDLPAGLAGRVLSVFLRFRLRKMQRTALRRLVAQSELDSS